MNIHTPKFDSPPYGEHNQVAPTEAEIKAFIRRLAEIAYSVCDAQAPSNAPALPEEQPNVVSSRSPKAKRQAAPAYNGDVDPL